MKKNREDRGLLKPLLVVGIIAVLLILCFELGGNYKGKSEKQKLEERVEELEAIVNSNKYIETFLENLEKLNVSDGITSEELLAFEDEHLKRILLFTIDGYLEDIYVETLIIEKLELAYESSDSDVKKEIKESIENHKESLKRTEESLSEMEAIYEKFFEESYETNYENLLKNK